MQSLILFLKAWLYRFGQAATLVTVGGLAAAAAPSALVQSAQPTAVVAPEPPPVRATPVPPPPQVRLIRFDKPVRGYVINSRYGRRRLAGEPHARMHQGVDFAAPIGTPVIASTEGVVTAAGSDAGYGRFVEVRHPNGLSTFYAHLSRIGPGVRAGARLEAGQEIGRVGSTGYSTGPHLHFEVRRRGARLDPAQYIGREFALKVPAGNTRRG